MDIWVAMREYQNMQDTYKNCKKDYEIKYKKMFEEHNIVSSPRVIYGDFWYWQFGIKKLERDIIVNPNYFEDFIATVGGNHR